MDALLLGHARRLLLGDALGLHAGRSADPLASAVRGHIGRIPAAVFDRELNVVPVGDGLESYKHKTKGTRGMSAQEKR